MSNADMGNLEEPETTNSQPQLADKRCEVANPWGVVNSTSLLTTVRPEEHKKQELERGK